MIIKIMSRAMAEQYKCNQKHVFISISEPHHEDANLPNNPLRLDVLRLNFYDLDKSDVYKDKERYISIKKQLPDVDEFLFNETHAQQILDFITKHCKLNHIDTVLIHCLAGVSRSAAVGASLSKIYNNDDNFFFKQYCPNRHIYRVILEKHFDSL